MDSTKARKEPIANITQNTVVKVSHIVNPKLSPYF